ncbi:MAG: hypothetical protein N2588_04475, partial [Rhodovarius sp.]|nr:hypothetical protein [Rhodovarius sp.]
SPDSASVRVMSEGELLEERRCRLVCLPDGAPAAGWRCLAYPLPEDGAIRAEDQGTPLALCSPWRPEEPPPRSSSRWALVEGMEEAWVLTAGSVAERDRIAALLRAAGLAVIRSGAWLGDPVEDFAADWFIRIARGAAPEALHRRIEEALGLAAAGAGGTGQPEELRRHLLRAEFDRLRGQVALLGSLVEQMRRERDGSHARAERVADLEAQIAELSRALEQARRAATERVEPPPPTAPSSRLARRMEQELATVLAELLPGLRFLRDSLTVASAEFKDRSGLYRAFRELQEMREAWPPAWKKLKGLDRWWERHVSTGVDDSGRIYACALPRRGGWEVLVSYKNEQDKDIAWLRQHRT